MSKLSIRFVSKNEQKVNEARAILGGEGIEVLPIFEDLEEIHSRDIEEIAKAKALSAFRQIGRPLIVEQTGLRLAYLREYFVGAANSLWYTLGPEGFCEVFGNCANPKVELISAVGYVDGQRRHAFKSTLSGIVAKAPRGGLDIPWGCVFIPAGQEPASGRTLAEIAESGGGAGGVSVRRAALEEFGRHFKRRGGHR